MANWTGWIGQLVLTTLCLYIIAMESDVEVEARGGRGGGFRSGFRSSRSYRSYRSSRSYRSVRSYRSGLSRMSATRKAIIAGAIFGAASYRRRRRYLSSPDSDPTVCHNSQYRGNGTLFYYGKFICPMDYQDDDYSYCCGPEGTQYCCKFFDDPGRTAGTVIGVIIAAAVVGAVIFFCVCKQKMNKSPGQVISSFRNRGKPGTRGYYSSAPTETHKVGYNAAPPPPQTMTYPVQPVNGPAPPAPPSYDAATANEKLPYELNPAGQPMSYPGSYPPPLDYTDPGYNKEPLPSGDISNAGTMPYPLNPPMPGADPSQSSAPYGGDQGIGFGTQPYPQGTGYPPPPGGNPYPPYPPQ